MRDVTMVTTHPPLHLVTMEGGKHRFSKCFSTKDLVPLAGGTPAPEYGTERCSVLTIHVTALVFKSGLDRQCTAYVLAAEKEICKHHIQAKSREQFFKV